MLRSRGLAGWSFLHRPLDTVELLDFRNSFSHVSSTLSRFAGALSSKDRFQPWLYFLAFKALECHQIRPSCENPSDIRTSGLTSPSNSAINPPFLPLTTQNVSASVW